MKTVEVTCDGCGRDLTTTGNSVDYRLVLANESLPLRGSSATDMMIYPPIKQTAHFCGVECLAGWLSKEYPKALEQFEAFKRFREDHPLKRAGSAP